ncbi:MAG: flagellar hook-basal body complex protein FliE [Chthoniobacteraceae bacterium]
MIVGSFPNLPPRELAGPILPDIATPPAAAPIGEAGQSGEAKGAGFSNLFERALGEVDAKLRTADAEKAKVLSGETNNLHQAVIAMQEAGIAFSLMVEVRNKLVESYQEMMRMQV